MTPRLLAIALAATTLVALPPVARAQDGEGPDLVVTAAVPPGGAASLALAQDLYALGVASGDALTLLAAARLAASVNLVTAAPRAIDMTRFRAEDLDQDGDDTGRGALPIPADAPSPIPDRRATGAVGKATLFTALSDDAGAADALPDALAMLSRARALAPDGDPVTALMADVETEAPRSQSGRATAWPSRLQGGQADLWELPVTGNTAAEVVVLGDGDTNLDVTITDRNGNVICLEVGGPDRITCAFTPARDGYFYVTVRNMGGLGNSYQLMSN